MRAREMHPLCCISIDCPGIGGDRGSRSPLPSKADLAGEERRRWEGNAGSEAGGVAGLLYKWTNYGKGWRCRWFTLRGGVLSYSKIRSPEQVVLDGEGVRLIGDPSLLLHRIEGGGGVGRKPRKAVGVVRLKISSFRESRSDDRRFYIFSSTKTLHLRTDIKSDRVAWIEALVSARRAFFLRSLTGRIPCFQNDVSFSTEKLRNRLLEEGISEALVKDCEKIMQLEFSHLRALYEDRLTLLAFRHFEDVNVENETAQTNDGLLLMKNDFSDSGHGKYSEYSTTESSDDIEKQEIDELSEEDELSFFDSKEFFSESPTSGGSTLRVTDCKALESVNCSGISEMILVDAEFSDHKFPLVERRKKLPEPVEKEKGVSLWSMIKDNVGKDLTRVCLPVYFNEPLSSLQKCFEDLEYYYLLDRAYEYGKMGNSLMRILNVAAFAVSGYASSEGRHCKPFNPLLGETYEADYPEKGVRFFSEKVSHHPTVIACHCEGRGWKFWGDSNLRSKFWGRSIQLDPVGVLTLEFDDGEIFQWSKVTTTIYNLIFGKVYCDHHGTMHIHGNRQYSCKLKFKEQSILDRNPHQVQGFVEDAMGTKHGTVIGKWDDSMYYMEGDATSKIKGCKPTENASLIWKRSNPPVNPTRYNLSSFAITLNELTLELQGRLPPTDSRLRPDQRHLENGEYEKANAEKLRLERRQRMSKKMQENGWKPRWFRKDSEDGTFYYTGGYWEAREQKKWDGCLDIFGEFSDDVDATSSK